MKALATNTNILTKRSPPVPSAVFDTYWRFAVERQEIFFRRLRGTPPPWTEDEILRVHKFTNAYRAADRVSQYLIRNVIYSGDSERTEVFFRCILFKIFNRESTWELLTSSLGELRYSMELLRQIDEVLTKKKETGGQIFSGAYIMPSGAKDFREPLKHRNYLALLQQMIADNLPHRLAECVSMADAFALLRAYPMIGDFLAYQFTVDINYSTLTSFSEMDFVMPGPGAQSGIRKCFTSLGDFSEADAIQLVTEHQDEEFARRGLTFRSLWGRPLQLIDCQNLFCEVDKYARIAHPQIAGKSDRTRIKQKFTANSQAVGYLFPPKWGINHFVDAKHE